MPESRLRRGGKAFNVSVSAVKTLRRLPSGTLDSAICFDDLSSWPDQAFVPEVPNSPGRSSAATGSAINSTASARIMFQEYGTLPSLCLPPRGLLAPPQGGDNRPSDIGAIGIRERSAFRAGLSMIVPRASTIAEMSERH